MDKYGWVSVLGSYHDTIYPVTRYLPYPALHVTKNKNKIEHFENTLFSSDFVDQKKKDVSKLVGVIR